MHRDNDLTFAPLFMLVSVKAAAVLGQPFPKCGAFHCFAPMYPYVILYTQNGGRAHTRLHPDRE